MSAASTSNSLRSRLRQEEAEQVPVQETKLSFRSRDEDKHAVTLLKDWRFWLLLLALSCLFAMALFVIAGQAEKERDLAWRNWQERLSFTAESRVDSFEAWLSQRRSRLEGLATNDLVHSYLAATRGRQLLPRQGLAQQTQGLAQQTQDLLAALGQAPLTTQALTTQALTTQVPAAQELYALLDIEGRILISNGPFGETPIPKTEGIHAERKDDLVTFTHVKGVADQSGQAVGLVVAQFSGSQDLPALLRSPSSYYDIMNIHLVRRTGNLIDYLVAGNPAVPPLEKSLPLDTKLLAAAEAMAKPGAVVEAIDFRKQKVLATLREVSLPGWGILVSVDHSAAFSETERAVRRLFLFSAITLVLALVLILLIWRHGASVNTAEQARRYQEAAEALHVNRALLKLVTDQQPNNIFILDGENRFVFANSPSADSMGAESSAELYGKSIKSVLGQAAVQDHLQAIALLRKEGRPQHRMRSTEAVDGEEQMMICDYLKVDNEVAQDGVLVIEQDVTKELAERRKREDTLNELVGALVQVVDRRDPYAADHSHLVSHLAVIISSELGLAENLRETVRLSAALMNIGKILVPESLLTRSDALSNEERAQIRNSMQMSADFLVDVPFDGPVAETLRQAYEHWDGTGPLGRKGEEILETARILAVSNAFVGMVSDRAHRKGLTVQQALLELEKNCGTVYDRRIVIALFNYLENKNGRSHWE